MANFPDPISFSTRSYIVPSTIAYFYGRILREDAEKIIIERNKSIGNKDGLFLLRESMQEIGQYALSIFDNNNIVHYKILRLEDHTVALINNKKQGQSFIGPIELINHYKNENDNLITKPRIPCDRPMGIQPIYYLFVSNSDLHNQINQEIDRSLQDIKQLSPNLYKQKLNESRTVMRYQHEKNLMKSLDKTVSLVPAWFKTNFSGLKARKILKKYKELDGAFLVRTLIKKKKTIILLSVIVERKMKNYEIKSSEDKFYLDAKFETRKFDSIIQLIDFHCRKRIDLPIQLVGPALKVSKIDTYQFSLGGYSQIYESNAYYDMLKQFQTGLYREEAPIEELKLEDFLKSLTRDRKEIFQRDENYSVIYEIQQNDLLYSENLHSDKLIERGNFGEVHFGTYKYKNTQNKIEELPVAIKKLHLNDEKSKKEIKKEADLMKSLDHQHIIKYLGLCYTSTDNREFLNIVLEYAKLGSLHTFLIDSKNFPMTKIVKICYQIASAMEYLTSKKIVHRDLASRNVLLVSEEKAKVSDFGLSRLTNNEGVYAADLRERKWPLRWFSPELMEKGNIKFDEKSDVWACGVCWWEATNYSALPYFETDLKSGIDLLKTRITNGYLLEKPEKCPEEIYTLMCKCWIINKEKRIKFSELVSEMKIVINDLYGMNV